MLTMNEIRSRAPSVFAREPWNKTSDKYQFFPTDYVVQGLMNNGFKCVMAGQAKTRIKGKGDFTRHILRFRHDDMPRLNDDALPEVVMVNSHDGSSSYRLMLGMFRMVCANGMIACSGMVNEVRVQHFGKQNVIDNVIEGSYQIINEAPKAIDQVRDWQSIVLKPKEQIILAESAIMVRGTSLKVDPIDLLKAKRPEDETNSDGSRNLWKTMNVTQEHLIRGGIQGESAKTSKIRRLRPIKSVVEDTRLNRELWAITERMAKLKTDYDQDLIQQAA